MNHRRISGALLALATMGVAGATQAAQPCDRACLEGLVEKYFDAVIENQPSKLPLAANAKFTEDGVQLAIGDGLWNTMKAKGKYRLFVTDVAAQQVAVLASIEEDHREADKSTPALISLRLKLRNDKITEIEQIVIRDEKAAQRVDAMTTDAIYLKNVATKMPRKAMIETADKYFTGMQQNDGKGDYPFADDCNRIENGGQATNAPTPAARRGLIRRLRRTTQASGAALSSSSRACCTS